MFIQIHPEDVHPGQRVAVSFGIVTCRGIGVGVPDRDHCTLYWEEEQPAVTYHRNNTVEVELFAQT